MTQENKFAPEQETEVFSIKQTVGHYLEALQVNDKKSALELLSADDRLLFSKDWDEGLLDDEAIFGKIGPYVLGTVSLMGKLDINGNVRDYAQAQVNFETEKLGTWNHRYKLVKEVDWKIYFGSDIFDQTWEVKEEPDLTIWRSIK